MKWQVSLFDGSTRFKIDKPIRLIELFAGYGSQHFALEYLGVDFESWKICEWAVKSISAYKDAHFSFDNTDYSKDLTREQVLEYLVSKGISANYNEPMTFEQIKRLGEEKMRTIYNNIQATHNLVNIQQAKGKDLEIANTDKYCYMMTYSFPCVTENTLVLSQKGYIPFRELKIGDKVLTKSNTWQKVVKQFDNGVTGVYRLDAMGTAGIECTKEHKFYAREMYRKGHRSVRCFKKPEMMHAKDLTKKHYLGIPVIQEEIPFYTDDINFWYLIGMYLGDGWLHKQSKDIRFGFNDKKFKLFDKLGYKYSVYDNEIGCKHIRINYKDIYEFINTYIGTGSGTKCIPIEILNLPKKQLQALYNGYLATDGCVIQNKHQFSSINESMTYSVVSIIHKLYNRPVSVYKIKVKPKKTIQGREVNQKDWYQIRFKLNDNKQDKAFYENGYIWFPFKQLTYLREDNVYNMEIENDHSYIINGVVSANCQDLSSAGLGKGMEKGSGTRSGMLWEVERLLDEIVNDGGELPQVLLMENVPEVIGTNNVQHFAKWIEKLEQLGYKNKWKVLNAKDFGIPQNRERCFMVSMLGDYWYEFPEPKKLELRLKDLLEDEVDEKYFLSDKAISGAINTNFHCSKLENRLPRDGIVPTICARDYKDPKCVQVAQLEGCFESTGRVYSPYGISPTITTCGGGNREPKILENENLKTQLCNSLIKNGKVKEGDVIRHSYSNNRMNKFYASNKENKDCSPTLDTRCDCLGVVVNSNNKRLKALVSKMDLSKGNQYLDIYNQSTSENAGTITTRVDASNSSAVYTNLRIRKLTARECFRLMGVKDSDFDNIAQNQSNASLYHLAGDSIVVDVLMAIFKEML